MTGCFHIPSFPAWVFVRALRERVPVAVVASGQVVACSRRAARAGIMPGISAERAGTLLPGIRLHPRDPRLEQAAWEEVLRDLHGLTPFIESETPGLVYFRADDPEPVKDLCNRLGGQVGLAPHRATALLAAVRARAGNTIVVPPERVPYLLERFETKFLERLDFTPEMREQLVFFGFPTLASMVRLTRRHLDAQFGDEGRQLFDLLHPPGDERPVGLYVLPPCIRVCFDFESPVFEPGDVLPVLEHLVAEAAGLLGSNLCRRVKLSIYLHRSSYPLGAGRILPESTGDPRRLLQTGKTLLMDLLAPGREVDTLAVELGSLHPSRPVQQSLFFKRPTVYDAVRKVHHKFPGVLRRAILHPHTLFEEESVSYEAFPLEAPKKKRTRKTS